MSKGGNKVPLNEVVEETEEDEKSSQRSMVNRIPLLLTREPATD